MNDFFKKNYVLVLSVLSSLTLVLQQVMTQTSTHPVDWKVIGFAVFVSILGAIAKEWGMKGLTILGIVGTAAAMFIQQNTTAPLTWTQFFGAVGLSIVGAIIEKVKGLGGTDTSGNP